MPTWREDTIQALKNLGGVAHLSEIHKEVEKLRKGKLNNTWTQTVQRELETYSSDSEAFGGGKDIFYMAEDYDLCTFEKHHKHKILLFLSSMRSFAEELKSKNFNLIYKDVNKDFKLSYEKKLEKTIKDKKIKEVSFF